jgi:ribosome-associated protein
MTSGGVLRIDSREHRTQAQNRAAARERLAELVRRAAARPKSRKKTRPTRTARERRLVAKVRRARVKAGRGRVRGEE